MTKGKRTWAGAALLLGLGALFWWSQTSDVANTTRRDKASPGQGSGRESSRLGAQQRLNNRGAASSTRQLSSNARECEPFARTGCYGGDVHWFDSCDRPLELQEDCRDGFCAHGACLDTDWILKCREPPEGRCEGDVLKLCDLGRDISIDCAKRGERCARGREGARCYPDRGGDSCRSAPPRCDGDVLVRCLEGVTERLDCTNMGAVCEAVAGQASCVGPRLESLREAEQDCGPCGCELEPLNTIEECNGLDDDENGKIDDGIDCGALRVDVLLGTGDHGEAIIDEAGLGAELARANSVFASSHSKIRFELGEISELDVADPSQLEFEELRELLRQERSETSGEEFSVKLVFVRRILDGGIPRLGVALPFVTEACGEVLHEGGLRFDHALVAIAEGRTPTTLAHELGHFLGLCHTHEADMPAQLPAEQTEDGELERCGEACAYGGDAMCDTPFDSEECTYDPNTCLASCPGGEQPATQNVMSYYQLCRTEFSPDQVALMEHTLALRRAWFACREGACPCQPGAAQCPTGMSCRPSSPEDKQFSCGMDGPRRPGEQCRGQADCSVRSLCLSGEQQSRCARSCQPGADPGCSCTKLAGAELYVCREDLTGSLASENDALQEP